MSLLDDLNAIGDFFGGGSTAGKLAGGALSGLGLQEAISNVGDIRTGIQQQASDYATRGGQAAAFQPFTVTTRGGTAQVGPTGGLQTTPEQTALSNLLTQRAGTLAGQTAPQTTAFGDISQQALAQSLGLLGQGTPTAQTLFEQMQAASLPEQERQRIALENRLAAQGRLGTQTAAFGGTPEALALEKAIQEQTAQNLVGAQTLAPQLAQQQLGLASGLFGLGSQAMAQPTAMEAANLQNIQALLGTSFLPEQQLLSALSPALQAAQLAQTGRASEAQLLGQLGPSVLESMYKTGETQATLEQAQINAVLEALGIQSAQPAPAPVFNITTPVQVG